MAVLAGLTSLASQAHAQIYSCVDSKGRTITADRLILECADRPQRELSPSGVTKRQVGPSLTAQEEMLQYQKDRQEANLRIRDAEAKRRDRALILRYPDVAAHDQGRAATLAQIDEAIRAANNAIGALLQERKAITNELAQYTKDPSQTPVALGLNLRDNKDRVQEYQKVIAAQEQEKVRVNQRFDEEQARLKQLWAAAKAAIPCQPQPACLSQRPPASLD